MPRVLRIINRFNLGGPTYNAGILSRYLPEEYQTKLIGGSIDESEAQSFHILDELKVDYETIPEMKRSLHPFHDLKAFFKIRKIIKDFKPDIVHTHASKAGTVGRLAAFSCRVPVVVHTFHGHVFHSYFGKLKTQFFIQIERYLARKSSAIIAISPQQKKELSEVYNICSTDKIHVVPLGFDLSRFGQQIDKKRADFRNEYDIENDTLTIGIIGRLVPIKNHRLFIQAIPEILKKRQGTLRFVIVGDGELTDELQLLTKELGIPFRYKNQGEKPVNGIEFTSWRTDVDVVLAGLDIVCLTSFNEGTPVSLIEAQAVGRPIVTTRVGGVEDVVQEEESGLICKSDDLDSFVHQLQRLVEDEMLREKMKKKGPDLVEKRFSYRRLVEDIQVLYEIKLNHSK